MAGLRLAAFGFAFLGVIGGHQGAFAQDADTSPDIKPATLDITPIIDGIINPPELSDEAKGAYRAMWEFDAAAYDFPQQLRDDLSQCDNEDAVGMLRAIRECWPVYEFYRLSTSYREARLDYNEIVSDPASTLLQVDAAYGRMASEAQGLREISKFNRYPAQFEVSLPAHLDRFSEFSHSRRFADALADVEEQIAAKHSGKLYLEKGFHNPFLHFSRAEMIAALTRPSPESFLNRDELARPIGHAEAETVFNDAFFDADAKRTMQLGVDPMRALLPGDCDGTDYQGLLRAIRFCEPIYRLYREANLASSSEWRADPSESSRIANLRVIERAQGTDLPAADFFEIVATVQEGAAAYGAGDDKAGDREIAKARAIFDRTQMKFAPDFAQLLDGLRERIENAPDDLETDEAPAL
jgi:hypothetical protein